MTIQSAHRIQKNVQGEDIESSNDSPNDDLDGEFKKDSRGYSQALNPQNRLNYLSYFLSGYEDGFNLFKLKDPVNI